MLDSETKRRIDTCRDILVGKVPDPKSQVEQITIALIYKFMDDMDAEAEELGGDRSFFTGEFARYGWSKLMAPGLGGHEMLSLYAEAIQRMNENPGIPPLFRDIFKNAFLPYRDPETLRSFLKEINSFTYDHSERLGDAFEYLLSVLGSQGEAGQFRTPRHIIDFMVEIIDPKKDETILDPACGTAGFLISSYKHILKHNSKEYREQQDREAYDEKGVPIEELPIDNPMRYSGDLLTPDDRRRLAANIGGYDISPDMVRLSLVNMYLHGFTDPHIEEYDTLTSDEKWSELADVILANPPFMSPKGGIRPHNRFAVQSKRSEVLFVDYIAEHLTPNGRAAVVVPEGIIFQSQTAYRQLREMLVKNYLVSVISLPAGVFNPYSGVKTSILVMDKRLAKQCDEVLFVKIENDGFNLGAQRRPIDKNDLPEAVRTLKAFLQQGEVAEHRNLLAVNRERIGENGEWNLSGDRYLDAKVHTTQWPLISLESIVDIESGSRQKGGALESGVASIGGEQIDELGSIRFNKMKYITEEHFAGMKKGVLRNGDVLLVKDGATTGKTGFFDHEMRAAVNEHVFLLRAKESIHPYFLYSVTRSSQFQEKLQRYIKGIIGGISLEIREIAIPIPPLEVQKEIVAEIEGYQKIIDGARQVVENYQPRIPIHPDWPMVELGEIAEFKNGLNFNKSEAGHALKMIGVGSFQSNLYVPIEELETVNLDNAPDDTYLVKGHDILFVRSNGNPDLVGRSIIVPDLSESVTFSGFTIRARFSDDRALPLFYAMLFKSREFAEMIKTVGQGANIRNLSQNILKRIEVPLPETSEQIAIVAEMEVEQRLIDANIKIILRFEEKIKQTINRVWGEAE